MYPYLPATPVEFHSLCCPFLSTNCTAPQSPAHWERGSIHITAPRAGCRARGRGISGTASHAAGQKYAGSRKRKRGEAALKGIDFFVRWPGSSQAAGQPGSGSCTQLPGAQLPNTEAAKPRLISRGLWATALAEPAAACCCCFSCSAAARVIMPAGMRAGGQKGGLLHWWRGEGWKGGREGRQAGSQRPRGKGCDTQAWQAGQQRGSSPTPEPTATPAPTRAAAQQAKGRRTGQ